MEEGLKVVVISLEARNIEYVGEGRGRVQMLGICGWIGLEWYGLEAEETKFSTGCAQLDSFTVQDQIGARGEGGESICARSIIVT